MDPLAPFREEVERGVSAAMKALGAEQELQMETPDPAIADFAFPCFPLAKAMRKAPAVIAEELAGRIPPSRMFERVWAEKGYLSFRVNQEELVRSTLDEVM